MVAISIRDTLLRAEQEPVWGRFLVREGFSPANLTDGLGARFLRDVQLGLDSGRFQTEDPATAFMLCAGGVLSAAAMDLHPESAVALAGLDAAEAPMPKRVAAAVLRVLGVPPEEAKALAARPFPAPPADPVTK